MGEPVKITCDKCGYSWYTKSELMFVTCPSCQQKVKNPRCDKSPIWGFNND